MDIFKWFRRAEKKKEVPPRDLSCCSNLGPDYDIPQIVYFSFLGPKYESNSSRKLPEKASGARKRIHRSRGIRRTHTKKHFSGAVKRFMNERCEYGEGKSISPIDLYQEYLSWCNVNKFTPINSRTFGNAISVYGRDRAVTRNSLRRAYNGSPWMEGIGLRRISC